MEEEKGEEKAKGENAKNRKMKRREAELVKETRKWQNRPQEAEEEERKDKRGNAYDEKIEKEKR